MGRAPPRTVVMMAAGKRGRCPTLHPLMSAIPLLLLVLLSAGSSGDDEWLEDFTQPSGTGVKRCFSCVDGLSAYQQIEKNLGYGSVEAPDFMRNRKPCGPGHISCGSTSTYTAPKVFKFKLYKDKDCEPVANVPGKQRIEIKVFSKSDDSLKGYEGATMRYSWNFRVHSTMKLSKKFTHIFQMKFVGGDQQKPVVTFTGSMKNGVPTLQLRTCPDSNSKEQTLKTVPWSDVAGKWMHATVEVKLLPLSKGGWMKASISQLDGGKEVLSWSGAAQMWRPPSHAHPSGNTFARPKWGIYRQNEHSLIKPGDLNDAQMYFADFCIERVV